MSGVWESYLIFIEDCCPMIIYLRNPEHLGDMFSFNYLMDTVDPPPSNAHAQTKFKTSLTHNI